jgi:hypothetical protein
MTNVQAPMTNQMANGKRQKTMTNQKTNCKQQEKRLARRFRRFSVCRLISHCCLYFAV